jgi:hypothetical protein
MKKKKNIIKKIESNKAFKFRFKKSFKHFFKKTYLKYKFFYRVGFFYKSFYKLNRLVKSFKYNILNINKNFIIKRSNYFNYISNGLDLKYNNIFQDLSNINYIYQFDKKKSIILNSCNLDIIKYQKFITFLEYNYIYSDKLNFNLSDFFESSFILYFSILYSSYNLCYILLIKNCF